MKQQWAQDILKLTEDEYKQLSQMQIQEKLCQMYKAKAGNSTQTNVADARDRGDPEADNDNANHNPNGPANANANNSFSYMKSEHNRHVGSLDSVPSDDEMSQDME